MNRMSCSKDRLTLPCLLLYRGYVMTEISFSNALSLANEFAVRLLYGTLNMRVNYKAKELPLFEQTHTTPWFTTDRINDIRGALLGNRLSKLQASGIESDSDSQWPESEIRHIVLYSQACEGSERKRATFDVYRDYLDGDEVRGWTQWRVKNVLIFFGERTIELVPEYLDRNDREPIWGTRIL